MRPLGRINAHALINVGNNVGRKTKRPEGRLFAVLLAGQKVCQHKLSSPRKPDFIRTSHQEQRRQIANYCISNDGFRPQPTLIQRAEPDGNAAILYRLTATAAKWQIF